MCAVSYGGGLLGECQIVSGYCDLRVRNDEQHYRHTGHHAPDDAL